MTEFNVYYTDANNEHHEVTGWPKVATAKDVAKLCLLYFQKPDVELPGDRQIMVVEKDNFENGALWELQGDASIRVWFGLVEIGRGSEYVEGDSDYERDETAA